MELRIFGKEGRQLEVFDNFRLKKRGEFSEIVRSVGKKKSFVGEKKSTSIEGILGGMRTHGRCTWQLKASAWRPSKFRS